MAGRLEGTVALVTGASSGIGEATALALAVEGAKVAIAARRRDRLERVVEEIGDADVLVIETDITEEGAPAGMVEDTVREYGRLDIVINNAGLMLLGPIVGAPMDEWERMLDLNVRALLATTHAALPHLLSAADSEPRKVADLVNVSSVAGRVARNGSGVYNTTKFGVGAFSESLRQEVTGRHVRVCVIEPGMVLTELGSHNRPEIIEQMRSTFGSIEGLHASDIAEAIVFAVTRPRRTAVNELLVRPTEQER